MKLRPRRYENRVAAALSAWFGKYGHEPVERIPVIGRTGPDLSWNDVKLIVDAKNRCEVPKKCLIPTSEIVAFQGWIGVQIADLDLLLSDQQPTQFLTPSAVVTEWWGHMAAWDQMPNSGIPVIVFARPKQIFKTSTVYLKDEHRQLLKERMCNGHSA